MQVKQIIPHSLNFTKEYILHNPDDSSDLIMQAPEMSWI